MAHFVHKYTRREREREREKREQKKKGEKRPYHQFGSDVKKPAMANGDCDGKDDDDDDAKKRKARKIHSATQVPARVPGDCMRGREAERRV